MFLEVGQNTPLAEPVNRAEDTWENGEWGFPVQFGFEPEAPHTSVWRGQLADVFG
jgi:hypothetical protein